MVHLPTRLGADVLVESLAVQGIAHMFGCCHESMLPVRHVLNHHPGLSYIEMKHEQAAVHAADGYARASGKLGVAIIGAGVTNGITGIATALSDSIPLLAIIGRPSPEEHLYAPDLDMLSLCTPVTKYHLQVSKINDIPSTIQRAYEIALDGRPGPVTVEIPTHLLHQETAEAYPMQKAVLPKSKNIRRKSLEAAITAIENAKKPVLFIGGGVIHSGASEWMREVATQSQIPVVSSLMGIGAFDKTNPLYLGMVGMHGTYAANKAVHQCDVLICVGVRFSDRVTGKISGFSPKSKKIHVDIDAAEINKNIHVDIPIVGDATQFFRSLAGRLRYPLVREHTKDWVAEVTKWQRTVPRFDTSTSRLKPQNVIRLLSALTEEDAIVVTDVGQHQIWTAHHYTFTKPRTFLTSGGLGTMGYGLPAAIGAAVASPGKKVICISGDGSFQMNVQEMMTAVTYKLPIKIAVLNNGYLGMVRQWQELFYQKRYSAVKITSPHFAKLAEAYGAIGYAVDSEEEAEDIIKKALKHDGPVLLDFNIAEEENVYPIVPPGQSNEQAILSH
ncbi:biosynthetic-type acetolactate synthase large subunit [Geobacillus stearothermophilus]|uniref:biosynthetic-type acetolactate synthase large subunit n=1 Tax=Geobacillus stearothermophilus TaxID=1422 RepID=UPI001EEE6E41|nr:biosynthetic-type acetolactate synthase large subunit [Geobacillus stearothermophilus]MCK7605560.1 biosynthetic-type acetolactate synthase large subunit [Geobacillus stearothermophilus]